MAAPEPKDAAQGSPFWQFSLRFYRRPGVSEACLVLQDEAGADVNLLLFLLWCAHERRSLPAAALEEIDRACDGWRSAVVAPLRAVRRRLKSPDLVEPALAEAYRARIKAVELEAERLQQEAMFARFGAAGRGGPAPSAVAAAQANLAAYCEVRDKPLAGPAVGTLLRAFAGIEGEDTA